MPFAVRRAGVTDSSDHRRGVEPVGYCECTFAFALFYSTGLENRSLSETLLDLCRHRFVIQELGLSVMKALDSVARL
jgi:hypothetical protein